jgi:hypothetical protein
LKDLFTVFVVERWWCGVAVTAMFDRFWPSPPALNRNGSEWSRVSEKCQ